MVRRAYRHVSRWPSPPLPLSSSPSPPLQYWDKTLGAKLTKTAMDVEGRNAGKIEIRGDELVFKGLNAKKQLIESLKELCPHLSLDT